MNQQIRNLVSLSIAALLTSWIPAAAWSAEGAPGRPLEKLNVAFSSISGNMAPLWVTQETGFFRKYGLDVQPILIESGTTTAQALAAGDISFAQVAGPAIIQANLRGADAVMIAGVVNTLTFQLYTEKGITQPDHFKGKAVGVTRYGSATDFAMRYALDKYGLDAKTDVNILELGNVPNLLTGLEGGKIQGAMLSAPTSLRAKKLGFPMMADLQMLGLEYQHTSIATSRALIKSRPELIRNFMRAYIEGIHFAKNNPKETLAILARYLRTADREILEDTYESIILRLIPEKPYPTQRGIQVILREMGLKDPAARSARPEQFVDVSIMKELDSSGFIDRVYKSRPAVASREEPRPAPAAAPVKEKPAPPPVIASPAPPKPQTAAPAPPAAPPAPAKVSIPPAKAPAPPASAAGLPQEYTVVAGDTLSHLALRYYGDQYQWTKIFEANKQSMKNPHYIYIGQKLMIPS